MKRGFDATWQARALQGDAEAVRRLAQAKLEPLYRFCFYRVGSNVHLCEEVVQETLLRAIRQLDRYQPDRCDNDILGWLTGLARNVIRSVLARERAAVSLEAMWVRMDEQLQAIFGRLESQPLTHEVLQREETRDLVNVTMSQLPPHYREALEQKYVTGRSVREIAGDRSVTEKSVESLLSRARRAFRDTFLALNSVPESL